MLLADVARKDRARTLGGDNHCRPDPCHTLGELATLCRITVQQLTLVRTLELEKMAGAPTQAYPCPLSCYQMLAEVLHSCNPRTNCEV